jgi:lipoate-protein ligase B
MKGDGVVAVDLGRLEYGAAFSLQRRLAERRAAEELPDLLLFVEHDPVVTLGRRGSYEHVFADRAELAQRGIRLYETNRGGLVTYHGPGQIVGYPIVQLRALAGDAPRYVSGLEEAIIRTLGDFDVVGRRMHGHRGVFADGGKIGAIGVAVSRGVTMHGFALNLQPDLGYFGLIDPCGLGDLGVTSVERITGQPVDLKEAMHALAFHFGRVFDRDVRLASASALEERTPVFQVQSL